MFYSATKRSQIPSSKIRSRVGKNAPNANDEREANIAFFVQISESNLHLVPRLLSRIWHPKNVYCLHLDKKISPQFRKRFENILSENKGLSNVYSMPSTVITYTGISMILNTLDSIETLLRRDEPWDYYINLSGSDYPFLSPAAIRRLLGKRHASEKQMSFVHFSTRPSWDQHVQHRFKWLHFDLALGFNSEVEESLHETFIKHPILATNNLDIEIPKGEAWVIAHRTFCQEVVTGAFGRRLLTLFANMQSPPEHFFQTLAWNHRVLNSSTVRHSLRLVRWKPKGPQKLRQHPLYLDDPSDNGTWLYWNSIKASSDIFARKFRIPDSPLMDHIDKYISGMGSKQTNTSKPFFERVNRYFNCLVTRESSSSDRQKKCTSGAQVEVPPPPPPAPKTKE
ncbi:unnamed protein product [Agarophyton chilense]